MHRFKILSVAILSAALVAGQTAVHAKARRVAVVNVGPADYDSAQRLLKLYGVLEALKKGAPEKRPRARPAPRPRKPAARRVAAADLGELQPIRGKALRRALVGLPHHEVRALAAATLKQGRQAFTALKRPEAAEAFAKAIALYDRHVVWSLARPKLIEALTYLFLCQDALGKTPEAVSTATRLRELNQNVRPKGVPANVWSRYPLKPAPLTGRRQIEVKVPAKAVVYLDDRLAGQGPQVLQAGPGRHRIRVELKGHQVFFQEVASGSTSPKVLVSLVPRSADAYGDVRRELRQLKRKGQLSAGRLKKLGERLSLKHLLVCRVEGKAIRLRWYSVRLGRISKRSLTLRDVGLASTSGQQQQLLAGPYSRMRKAERKAEEGDREERENDKKKKSKKPKLWKKWYFWVAAAVIAGVVAAFAIKDSLDEDKVILRVTRP